MIVIVDYGMGNIRSVAQALLKVAPDARVVIANTPEQIRVAAKTDKRISYIIHVGKIASPLLGWKWRKYKGINSHHKHIHISFKKNQDNKFFNIPLLGGK